MSIPSNNACPLCLEAGGMLIVQTPLWRVVRVEDANFPAFYRLIWLGHVAEFSDLSDADALACMRAVTAIERVLRGALRPTKVNLASLGNVVPHLHWHVVARFDWDSHFPNPIWGEPLRALAEPAQARLALGLPALDAQVAQALAGLN
ncbi:HIT family protein [Paucibacter sp. B2R-40]|uniref:HIT family protein n=1 Tax=Paucibacter sp. B2R-40 TaxID=2893554 RepID=UPI0021E3B236|nr:HIT family protein [Paucibacter sp. B2R-40]MCV2355233.1 HIT family protein [Paucibacter sp. B2R-40]